jgi:hypothetical protein
MKIILSWVMGAATSLSWVGAFTLTHSSTIDVAWPIVPAVLGSLAALIYLTIMTIKESNLD